MGSAVAAVPMGVKEPTVVTATSRMAGMIDRYRLILNTVTSQGNVLVGTVEGVDTPAEVSEGNGFTYTINEFLDDMDRIATRFEEEQLRLGVFTG